MKTVISVFVALVIAIALHQGVKAAGESSMPPGISADAWVPISDTAGFLISPSAMPTQKGASSQVLTGYFFARKNGIWFRLNAAPVPTLFDTK